MVQHFRSCRVHGRLLLDKAGLRYSHLNLSEASEPSPGSGEGLESRLGTREFCLEKQERAELSINCRKGDDGFKRLLCRRLVLNSTKCSPKIRDFSGISGNGSVAQKVSTLFCRHGKNI